ncbi:MAG: ribonuclease R [Eubacterium sp.]|nr:ribonuclease R [Eubacterium sp.]MDD7209615.1 ribonuclease R [Lachnospiraceae bacterium]MDY5497982.1 ribonuclease R [Anaerobutyricum sp.]
MKDRLLFEQRKNSIKDMIYDPEYIPLKLKEMAYLMNVPQKDRNELKEVMDALVAEGSVELTSRGKYVKPEKRNLTGTFTSNQKGFGFVTVEGEEEDIFIPAAYVNGALHKDVVRVKVTKKGSQGKRAEGMITKILERGCKKLVGTFQKSKEFGFVIPDDPHYDKDIFVSRKKMNGARDNDKVIVSLTGFGGEGKKPEGTITEILGQIDDPSTDVSSIVKAYDIEEKFPKSVLREAGSISQEVEKKLIGTRSDFRNLLTVTIDGEDARDLDDAISLEKKDGMYYLGVHIADVSHYVKEGSPLDKEALARGTSVYLTDRVIPMLPRELSNGICSLNAGVDRLALSCMMTFGPDGNVTDHVITESVIHVDERMSYTGVNAILNGEKHPEGCREEIRNLCFLMREAAVVLKEKRRKRGAIDFDFPESKIIVDETGFPVEIHPYERNVATDIIEDFMLLANETVAEDYFWQEIPFIYRTHEAPDADKIKKLDTFIRNFGYYMKTGKENFHPKEIQKLLFSLEGEPEEPLISRLALRSMKQAKYTTLNVGHFGLSTQYYTHFTSPIRRYPDLQIHRIIKENIHGKLSRKRLSHYEEILPSVAQRSSVMERRAQDAEREVEKLKKVEYMQQFIGESFSGVISGVTSWGFFVELENTVEGLVPINSLLDDFYIFDEETYKLIGEHSGRIFTLGQRVDIVVESADKMERTIDFVLREFSEEEFSEDEFMINDWMEDEEVEELLHLYEKKSVDQI